MNNKTQNLTQSALVAGIYVVLTFVSQAFGLANGVVQVRLSEMLTILPAFSVSMIGGLTVGCLLANIMTGCALWDIVFGTLATLIGAVGTYYISKSNSKIAIKLAPIPPILSNALIVPLILQYVYGIKGSYLYFVLTVGIGEIISCYILGLLLHKALKGKVFL